MPRPTRIRAKKPNNSACSIWYFLPIPGMMDAICQHVYGNYIPRDYENGFWATGSGNTSRHQTCVLDKLWIIRYKFTSTAFRCVEANEARLTNRQPLRWTKWLFNVSAESGRTLLRSLKAACFSPKAVWQQPLYIYYIIIYYVGCFLPILFLFLFGKLGCIIKCNLILSLK